MSWRRLWVLVNGLPSEAATWRLETSWTIENEMAATHLELMDMWFRILAVVMGANYKKLPDQIRWPRPWDSPPEPRKVDPGEVLKFFGQV